MMSEKRYFGYGSRKINQNKIIVKYLITNAILHRDSDQHTTQLDLFSSTRYFILLLSWLTCC